MKNETHSKLACNDAFTGCNGVCVRIDKRSFNDVAEIVLVKTVGFEGVFILDIVNEDSEDAILGVDEKIPTTGSAVSGRNWQGAAVTQIASDNDRQSNLGHM